MEFLCVFYPALQVFTLVDSPTVTFPQARSFLSGSAQLSLCRTTTAAGAATLTWDNSVLSHLAYKYSIKCIKKWFNYSLQAIYTQERTSDVRFNVGAENYGTLA